MQTFHAIEEQITTRWSSMRQVKNQHSREHIHIARYIRPEMAEFFEERKTSDRPAIEMLWDDTAPKANDMFARGLWSLTHNSSTEWFGYSGEAEGNSRDAEATEWWTKVNDDITEELLDSGCYAALLARLTDVGAWGFGAIYSYEEPGSQGKIIFEWVPASECFYTTGRNGLANSFIRPLNLTAEQAITERGWPRASMDQTVQDAFDRKDVNSKFLFLHVVWERKGRIPGERPKSNKDYPWAGYYYQVANRKVIDEHGFRDFPYHVLGWGGAGNQSYPIGIGYRTLPEIRNINGQRKKFDRLLDIESDPAILAPNQDEGRAQQRPQPGEMIYNGMSGDGKRLYEPLVTSQGSRSIENEINTSRTLIQEAWHYALFMMQTQRQMTAEEVRSRDAKLIQAMGPFLILMVGDLRTIVDRVFWSRLEAGVYDPLPRSFGPATKLKLKFKGLLAKAMEVLEGEQIVQLYQEAGMITQLFPEARPEINATLDHAEAFRALSRSKSLPGGVIRSADESRKKLDEERQAQQQAQMAAMAPDMAKAAKDGSEAVRNINGSANSPVAA